MDYRPRNGLMTDENIDMLADCHGILNRWKNCISQLLNVSNISDIRQIQIHTAESLVPAPSRLVAEVPIANLKMYKLPGSHQIPGELVQAGYKTLLSQIQKPNSSSWN
jgi:hypothetical protein